MIHALRYTEELEKSGFSPEQAKQSVKIWMELMDQNFATKSDLVEMALKNEIVLSNVRSELKEDITKLSSEVRKLGSDLTIKLGVMLAASVGIMSTMMVLLKT